jgi:hypothetical protein
MGLNFIGTYVHASIDFSILNISVSFIRTAENPSTRWHLKTIYVDITRRNLIMVVTIESVWAELLWLLGGGLAGLFSDIGSARGTGMAEKPRRVCCLKTESVFQMPDSAGYAGYAGLSVWFICSSRCFKSAFSAEI